MAGYQTEHELNTMEPKEILVKLSKGLLNDKQKEVLRAVRTDLTHGVGKADIARKYHIKADVLMALEQGGLVSEAEKEEIRAQRAEARAANKVSMS